MDQQNSTSSTSSEYARALDDLPPPEESPTSPLLSDGRRSGTLHQDFNEALQPREVLKQYGPDALDPERLLAILIRVGRPGRNVMTIAKDLLHAFNGSFTMMSKASYKDLMKKGRIGEVMAMELAAAFAIARRTIAEGNHKLQSMKEAESVARFLWPHIMDRKTEGFYAIPLDKKIKICGPISTLCVSKGTADATLVHPRDVYREAVLNDACYMIVAHNHPSGDPTPSPQDIRLTRELLEAGRVLHIPLLDHIIIGDLPQSSSTPDLDATPCPRFVSLRRSGMVDFSYNR